MRKITVAIAFACVLAACSPTEVGPNALTAEDRATQQLATTKLMCRVENQARCAHIIENRILFGRFFAPETLGGLKPEKKNKGRRVTTKFISEAVASINTCERVNAESIPLVKDIKLAGGTYEFRGTSPLDEQNSACFLTQSNEN